ncbi:hypothetical protein ACS0TY_026513 [Phlomoides rotata]
MGKGLIPADGEIWRVRRRAIVPALHQKFVAAMFSLFGEATDRLCKKLDAATSDGEDVEMESLFSRLTLDIIGKAVFNYDFDSLSVDTGIVEAVYTVLKEVEDRSTSPIPFWEIPIWKDISPKLKKVNAALNLIASMNTRPLAGLFFLCNPAACTLPLSHFAQVLYVGAGRAIFASGSPFDPVEVLHGGVSALITKALASMGAHIASGFNRIAGIQLTINHLKSAVLGDFTVAKATPVNVGKSIQVWDVHLSKCDSSNSEIKTLVASSRVTLLCNLPVPETVRDASQNLKKYAKL